MLSPSLALLKGLETLLETWNHELRRLGAALEDARKHGCLEVAVLYHRQMRGIVERSELLRTALASACSPTGVPPNSAGTGVPAVASAPPSHLPTREVQADGRGSGL